jgi:hypothetical protein
MDYDASVASSEVQKAKLQATFQFKGGKALPSAGMMAPLDAGTLPPPVEVGARHVAAAKLSEEEKLFQQVGR